MNQLWSFLIGLIGHVFLLLIFAMFCFVGISAIANSYKTLRTSIRSKHWPRIQGKIIRYEVDSYTTGGQSSQTKYGYTIISSYEIQGHFYPSHYAWHGGFATWEIAEQEALRLSPIGQWVELAYNPQEPQQSQPATEVGWDWDSCIGILFGIPFFSLGSGLSLVQILRIFGTPTDAAVGIAIPFLIAAVTFAIMLLWFATLSLSIMAMRQCFREIRNIHKRDFKVSAVRFLRSLMMFSFACVLACVLGRQLFTQIAGLVYLLGKIVSNLI